MSYCNTESIEKARLRAVKEVLAGTSVTTVARRYNCYRSTIYTWKKRYEELQKTANVTGEEIKSIPTISSAPRHHTNRISPYIENLIIDIRKKYHRCAEVIHAEILRRGLCVGLTTVYRVLKRHQFINHSNKYKRQRKPSKRPKVNHPGALVEVDTVVLLHPFTKQYYYATSVIDVYSRMAYVYLHEHNTMEEAFRGVLYARNYFPFPIDTIQADNGAEFQSDFELHLKKLNINLRHTRVRTPNDNAHVERFNRTLRDECLGDYISSQEDLDCAKERLLQWLEYYNCYRLHMGIHMQYPIVLARTLRI